MMRGLPSLKWLLTASVALNVFFVTVLAMIYPPPPPGPLPRLEVIAERLAASLPPADAAVLRRVVADHRGEIESGRTILHGLPDRVRAILATSPFDPAALTAVFREVREAHARTDDAMAALVIEVATGLSEEGRRTIARWRPPPPPGGDRGPPGHRPPPGGFGPPPPGGFGPPPPE